MAKKTSEEIRQQYEKFRANMPEGVAGTLSESAMKVEFRLRILEARADERDAKDAERGQRS